MSVTRRNIARLAAAGALTGLVPARGFAQDKKILNLGMYVPITGNQAQYGQDMQRGAELAVSQLNQEGTVPWANFQLVVEDSKGDPQEAANVAQKLVARNDITAVIGDFSSTATLAAAPIFQRAQLIMITPVASHPDITKTGNFIFRNTPIASSEVNAVTDWGTKDLAFKKIAVIGRNDDYGRVYGDLFKKRAIENGATVVGEQYFDGDTQDLKPVITSLRPHQPDCVLLALFQVEAALLFRQSREMNFHPTFMSGAGLFNPQLITLAREAANGLLLVSTFYPQSDRPQVKSFVDLFKAKYGNVPSKFSAHAFNSTYIIANAIKHAGAGADEAKIRDAMAATKNMMGVTGSLSFDSNREVIMALQRLTIKNQEFVLWKKA